MRWDGARPVQVELLADELKKLVGWGADPARLALKPVLRQLAAVPQSLPRITAGCIVRRYLEDRFVVRAPEMTTEEFLEATARSAVLQPGQRQLLGDFLAESDLVKFARHVPTLADSDRVLGAAERFVDETAIREQLPAEEHRAVG